MRQYTNIVDYKREEAWAACSLDIMGWDTGFHDLMLNDHVRMTAYEQAIKAAVRPGMVVLDLGTGTGILAKWAIEAGAARVYGIEVSSKMLAIAQTNLELAGLADKFVPVLGMSYDVRLPEQVDIVISEILGNIGDNEDCGPILNDARQRFLKPSGAMLPKEVTSYFVPVSSMEMHRQIASGRCKNLSGETDLASLCAALDIDCPFNLYYDAILPKSTHMAQPQTGRHIDFANGTSSPSHDIQLTFRVMESRVLTGFKGYFFARLTECTALDIGGDDIDLRTASDSWKHCYMPLQRPIDVEAGDIIRFNLRRKSGSDLSKVACLYSWSGTVERAEQIFATFLQTMG